MFIAKTLAALGDPTRIKILELLKKRELPAGEIGKYFPITAPSLSHHLSVLKETDLISVRRFGQQKIYSINLSVFEEVAESLVKIFKKK